MLALTLDIRSALGTLLDAFTATGGGRVQRFQFLPWGRHQDQREWSALPVASGGRTVGDSAFSIRGVTNPTTNLDIGGDAAGNKQVVDVMVWWTDGSDITDAEAFRVAVTVAIKTIVRANQRSVGPATFTYVSNVLDGDFLQGSGGASTLAHLHILTVSAEAHEVY